MDHGQIQSSVKIKNNRNHWEKVGKLDLKSRPLFRKCLPYYLKKFCFI